MRRCSCCRGCTTAGMVALQALVFVLVLVLMHSVAASRQQLPPSKPVRPVVAVVMVMRVVMMQRGTGGCSA